VEGLENLILPSFLPPVTYPAGLAASFVAVGDFNGDGIPDLVATNANSNTVSVLLGNGDGTFQAGQSFAAESGPNSVAVGDFTGTGILDLAVTNGSSGTVSILLGNADGTFAAPVAYHAGVTPTNVAVGDFNGDGNLDLAVTNLGSPPDYAGTVSVLLGNGDGSFQAAVNYTVGSRPIPLVIADFNGDGNMDLAVGNSFSSTVSVLLGNGDGSFQDAQDFAAGPFSASLVAGDFNGDGAVDLAVTNDMRSGTVSVLLGNGDGSFQPRNIYPVGSYPYGVAAADFNSDGALDLGVVNEGSNDVSILLGNGDGSFQGQARYADGGGGSQIPATGDFNGDGYPDVVITNRTNNSVSVLINGADWPGPPVPHPAGNSPSRQASFSGPSAAVSGLRVGFGAQSDLAGFAVHQVITITRTGGSPVSDIRPTLLVVSASAASPGILRPGWYPVRSGSLGDDLDAAELNGSTADEQVGKIALAGLAEVARARS
jgi:hypothetical protein